MEENVFRRKKTPTPAQDSSKELSGSGQQNFDNADLLSQANKALGHCQIVHGAQSPTYAIAGKTVAYVRDVLGVLLNVPAGAQAVLNGELVPLDQEKDTVLEAGCRLEFIMASGDKGN